MARVMLILTDATRAKAKAWIDNAPDRTRMELKEAKRSNAQNAAMWAALTDLSVQLKWHGMKLSAEDWKHLCLNALGAEMRLVPNLDGTGFVNLGRSSSDLSKGEMSELLELIYAFGAQRGVSFNDGAEIAA